MAIRSVLLYCIFLLVLPDLFTQEIPVIQDINITTCVIGKPTCKIQTLIQKWKLVNCEDPTMWLQTLSGEVLSVGHNKTKNPNRRCKLHDGDWGIYINPDPAYSHLTFNSKGKQNQRKGDHQPGYIKAEIKLGDQQNILWDELDLKKLFPPGSHIETYGWWVQDYGHKPTNPATEIHPFIYMRTLTDYSTADSFAIFIADDCSERFAVSDHDILWSFSIPLKSNLITREISQSGITSYQVPLDWIEESFIMDQFNDDSINFAASQTGISQSRDTIGWNIHLSRDASTPFYRGIFRRFMNSDTSSFYLHEQINNFIDDENGSQIYRCAIKLELKSIDPSRVLTNSTWIIRDHEKEGNLVICGNKDQHIYIDTLSYSASLNINDTVRDIHIMGSNLPDNFIPAITTRNDGGSFAGPYKRVITHANRKYKMLLPKNQ